MTEARQAGWVFSAAADALVFVLPLLVSALIWAGCRAAGVDHLSIPLLLSLLLYSAFDHTHVYSTYTLIYTQPGEFAKHPRLYGMLPAAVFIAFALLYAWDPVLFVVGFAVFSVFHFIRQQIGWMAVAARKAGVAGTLWWDKTAIYTATLGPALYGAATIDGIGWFAAGDLPGLPAAAAPWLYAWIYGFSSGYLIFELAHRRAGRLPRLLIWSSSLFVWHTTFMWNVDYTFGAALIVLHHAIPYLYLAYRYRCTRLPAVTPFKWIYLLLCLVGTLEFLTRTYADNLLSVLTWLARRDAAAQVLFPLLVTPSATHYLIDTFFWKHRYNPGVFQWKPLPGTSANGAGIELKKQHVDAQAG